jgi:tRNA pseudouridine55 synthase
VHALATVKLSTSAVFYMRTGQPVMVPHLPTSGVVQLCTQDGLFLGVGEILDDGRVAPRRLISQPERIAKAV